MEIQNQVGHRLRGNLSRLHNVLDAAASQGIRSLGQVADRVCEAFDLRDGRGRCQRASCRKALADLEAAGEVSLPAPRRRAGAVRRPRVPVTSTADAQRILQWYALRWRIEDYYRILKSGCKVEELQHHSAERLERAIAIKMVVGWRIQLMVRLGREVPELPSELLFSDGELRVLATFARSRELPPPERLGDAVGLVARLGGWLGRTRDPPGAQLMWHGYTSACPSRRSAIGLQRSGVEERVLFSTNRWRRGSLGRDILRAAMRSSMPSVPSMRLSGGRVRASG